MLNKVESPAVLRHGEAHMRTSSSTDEFTARRAKRKNGNVWYEEGGRYLWKYGPHGSTCFDTGEPLPRRGA